MTRPIHPAIRAAAPALASIALAHAHAGTCPLDLDSSGAVDGADLGVMLAAWGTAEHDATGDGFVDGADLGILLAAWGPCPADPEWTLVTATNSGSTVAYDAAWNAVRTWMGAAGGASVAYLRPDGSLVRPCVLPGGGFNAGGRGGRVQVFAPDGTLQHDVRVAGTGFLQHHDVRPMPNGNVLCIVWESRTQAEAQAAGRQGIAGPMWSERIIEIRFTGFATYDVVWEWSLWDHLVQSVDPSLPGYGIPSQLPGRFDINRGNVTTAGDWVHLNAIDYSPARDEIVVSSRNVNEVWVIDHSTTTAEAAGSTGGARGRGGEFLYRWGNPANYGRGAESDARFSVVHGAAWVPAGQAGAGNILAFNNGDRPGSANDWSQVVELVPPRGGDGGYELPATSAFGPAQPAWTFGGTGTFYGGPTQCGAFRTPAGTTLVTVSSSSTVIEVAPSGAVLSTWVAPVNLARAVRYRQVGGQWVGP
jgi:hypothetical protein